VHSVDILLCSRLSYGIFNPSTLKTTLVVGIMACKKESGDAGVYLILSALGLTRLTDGFVAIALCLPTAVMMLPWSKQQRQVRLLFCAGIASGVIWTSSSRISRCRNFACLHWHCEISCRDRFKLSQQWGIGKGGRMVEYSNKVIYTT
jgi:hypothetical protein